MLKYYVLCVSLLSFDFLQAKKNNLSSCKKTESSIQKTISSLLKKYGYELVTSLPNNIEGEKTVGDNVKHLSIHYTVCSENNNFIKITKSEKSEKKRNTTSESFYSKRKTTNMIEESLPQGQEITTVQRLVESVL